MSVYGYYTKDSELYHHGIKGQKWGIRRFQNSDGSLTSEGMRRYGVYSQHKQIANKFDSMTNKMSKNKSLLKDKAFMDEYKKAGADWENELKKYKDKDYRKSIKTGKKLEKHLSNSITDKVLKGEKVGLSNKKYVNVGKSYEKKNGTYKHPKTREDAIDIIKYDRDKTQKNGSGFGGTFYESGNILNPTHQLIYHYSDKNGNIALSYCRVPGYGDIYVKGFGNINDIDMNKFKKPPKKIED